MSVENPISVRDFLDVLANVKSPLAPITHDGNDIGTIEYIPEENALVLGLEDGLSLLVRMHVLPLFQECQEVEGIGLFGLGRDYSQPMDFDKVKVYYCNTDSPIIGMDISDDFVELVVANKKL